MRIDKFNQFSDAQAVTATAISENVIDAQHVSNTLKDLGAGEELYLVVVCTTAMTDAGSDSTVTVTLESDSAADLATSATVHVTLPVFAALSAAGTQRVVAIPQSLLYERYLGVRYTVANGNLTTGSFTAFLTEEVPSWKAYATSHNTKTGR